RMTAERPARTGPRHSALSAGISSRNDGTQLFVPAKAAMYGIRHYPRGVGDIAPRPPERRHRCHGSVPVSDPNRHDKRASTEQSRGHTARPDDLEDEEKILDARPDV